jgi:hypothetical protein
MLKLIGISAVVYVLFALGLAQVAFAIIADVADFFAQVRI